MLTVPKDENWVGHWRWGPYLLKPITILVIILWVLTIAQIGYGLNHGPPGWSDEYYIEPKNQPGVFAYMLAVPAFELIHLPIHIMLYLQAFRGWRLHPVAALTMSTFMIGPWIFYATYNWVFDFIGCDCQLNDAWAVLSGLKDGIAHVIFILYVVYMGFAARAVHEWRGRTGRRRGFKGELKARSSLEDGPIDEVEQSAGKR